MDEKQKILILARARKRKAESEGQTGGDAKDFANVSFLNKAMAETLGAPVDLIAAGLRSVGLPVPEDSFGGSKSIRRGMASIGAETPDREPETVAENIFSVGGEIAGLALPSSAVAKSLSVAKGTVGAIASAMNKPMTSARGALGALGVESGAATGAGLARNISQEQEHSPITKMTLETLGGLGGGFLASGPILRATKSATQRVFSPFSEKGSFERASVRAREVVDDKQLAIQNIEDLKGSNLMPSAKSQDPGLMALEKTIGVRDKALASKLNRQTSDAVNDLVNSIKESGNVKSLKNFLAKKSDRLKKAATARVEVAAEQARDTIEKLNIPSNEVQINLVLREELESALADARVQEDLLWAAVPMEAKASTSNTFNKYRSIKKDLAKAQSDDMPPEASKLLGKVDEDVKISSGLLDASGNDILIDDVLTNRGKFKAQESVKELDGLYKRLGETARKARLASENNKARIAEELRESILLDMKTIKGNDKAKNAVSTARAFSRQLNEKFNTGTIGKILGVSKGSKPSPEELTLASGVSGIKGKLFAEEVSKALDKSVTELGAIQDFIKKRFLDSTIEDGNINPTKARNFIASHKEVLDFYPHLRNQLSSARSAEDALRRITKYADSYVRKLDSKSVSSIAKILKAPVDSEMSKIFNSDDPVRFMTLLANSAKKDDTGLAYKGLRAGVSQYLINSMTKSDVLDIKGRPFIAGSKLKSILTNDQSRKALSRVFLPKELNNLDKVADELVVAQKRSQARGNPFDYIINDRSSWLLRTAARIGGARIGSKMAAGSGAGGSIQSAAIGSDVATKIIDKLTKDKAEQMLIDALTTDQGMLVEMLKPRSKMVDKKMGIKLRNYMINNGARLFEDEDQ